MFIVSSFHENLESRFFQFSFGFIRVVSFCKIMIKSCARVLWMTDRHFWEIKVIDGIDCNGCGNGGILPRLVRLANQDSGNNETETNNARPENLCCPCLRKTVYTQEEQHLIFQPAREARRLEQGPEGAFRVPARSALGGLFLAQLSLVGPTG